MGKLVLTDCEALYNMMEWDGIEPSSHHLAECQDILEMLGGRLRGYLDATALSLEQRCDVAEDSMALIAALAGLLLSLGLPVQDLWDEYHAAHLRMARRACVWCESTGTITGEGGEREKCPDCRGRGHTYKLVLDKNGYPVPPQGWEPPNIRRIIEQASVEG